MKLKEIRELEGNKLRQRLVELHEKVRDLRFGVANRQVKNIRELRSVKREIAKVMTVMNQHASPSHDDQKKTQTPNT